MININTDRLVIRNFLINDWKALLEIVIDKEESEYAMYDYQFPTSEHEVKGIAEWFSKGNSFLAVQLLTNRKVIGYISLNGENDFERDFGYCFNSRYHGQGYATELCSAVINYAFNVLKISKITSGTATINLPSCRLLNRLGFVKIGESITSFRKTLEGTPIEFMGSLYLLEKDNWNKDKTNM